MAGHLTPQSRCASHSLPPSSFTKTPPDPLPDAETVKQVPVESSARRDNQSPVTCSRRAASLALSAVLASLGAAPATQPSDRAPSAPATRAVARTDAAGPNGAPVGAPATQPVTFVAPSEGAQPLAPRAGDLPEVVVTATRAPTSPAQLGSAVSVITGEEIERRQITNTADALRGVPGVDVARSGGANQITSVFLRGSDSSHTLVLIDGIPSNDPTSPNRAFNFGDITTDDIDRIEVLRGPQSTLWGSNAMGGVVNIITRRGEGPPHGYAFAEGGSFYTAREGAGVSGGNKDVNYSLSVSQADSQGFSAADAKYGNKEPDGFSRTALAGKVGWNLSPNLDVDFITRYIHDTTDIDDFGGPGGDDPHRELKSDEAFFRIQPHLLLADGFWEQTFGLNYAYYARDDNDDQFPAHYHGGTLQFDWQNDFHLTKTQTLTAGAVYQEETFHSDTVSGKSAESTAVYLQDALSFADRLFLTGGLRYEDHSDTESSTTYRLTGAYRFPTSSKLHASYGTGFKAPSLSNLYSAFGSPDLKPEKVRGWDVGLEQALGSDRFLMDVTYFRNDFSNLIDFNFVSNRLENVGAASTDGVELTFTLRPVKDVSVGLNYTYTDTLNRVTDKELLRRSPNKIGVDVDWRYSARGDITLSGVYNGKRRDIDPISFSQADIGDYTLLNIATSYRLTDHLTLYARAENLLNQHYQEVAGFGTAGISFYGGMKLSF